MYLNGDSYELLFFFFSLTKEVYRGCLSLTLKYGVYFFTLFLIVLVLLDYFSVNVCVRFLILIVIIQSGTALFSV